MRSSTEILLQKEVRGNTRRKREAHKRTKQHKKRKKYYVDHGKYLALTGVHRRAKKHKTQEALT